MQHTNSCSICKERYNETDHLPKILPCGHTFCQSCTSHLHNQGALICPKDKIVHSTQVSDLSTNFAVLDLFQPSASTPDLLCCNGHPLSPQQSKSPAKCSMCKLSASQYQECRLCLYQICQECRAWMHSNTIPDQGLICFRGHQLRIAENVEKFYEGIRGVKKTMGKFLCDGCLVKKTGGSAQCRECTVDYCSDCLGKYQRIMERGEALMCGKKKYHGIVGFITRNYTGCNARLAWRPDKVEFTCAGCRYYFNKSGCFLCRECDWGLCINCAHRKLA